MPKNKTTKTNIDAKEKIMFLVFFFKRDVPHVTWKQCTDTCRVSAPPAPTLQSSIHLSVPSTPAGNLKSGHTEDQIRIMAKRKWMVEKSVGSLVPPAGHLVS